jgi:hypothetical protein
MLPGFDAKQLAQRVPRHGVVWVERLDVGKNILDVLDELLMALLTRPPAQLFLLRVAGRVRNVRIRRITPVPVACYEWEYVISPMIRSCKNDPY